MPRSKYIGGARGSRSGTIIIVPAVREGKKIIEPEKIYARRRYRDPETGKLREKKRLVQTRTEAKEKQHELLDEIKADKKKLAQAADPENKTWSDLLAYFRKRYAKPAEYRGGVKIGGYITIRNLNWQLNVVKTFFAAGRRLRTITYDDLADLKTKRLETDIVTVRTKTTKKKGVEKVATRRPRSATAVHRDLQLVRRMFNIAIQKKWLTENPFKGGDPLIPTAGEPERMRILSHQEEKSLIEVCFGQREHTGDAVIFALETVTRENEQFAVTCEQVDLVAGVIPVYRVPGNRKRLFDRWIPISDRLRPVLKKLIAAAGGSGPLFPQRDLKRSFKTALRLAGIEGMRWHDLRHTGITWMLEATGDPGLVMKVSGHKEWKTFLRYVNFNADVARRFAQQIDAHRARVESEHSKRSESRAN